MQMSPGDAGARARLENAAQRKQGAPGQARNSFVSSQDKTGKSAGHSAFSSP